MMYLMLFVTFRRYLIIYNEIAMYSEVQQKLFNIYLQTKKNLQSGGNDDLKIVLLLTLMISCFQVYL